MEESLPTLAALIRPDATVDELAEAVQHCRGCDLWRDATRAVFGEGASRALVVMVGEQPGDVEDRRGRPFVGPAGILLRSCLAEVGILESDVWLTNVVKHFKWQPKGKRRIHRTPAAAEIAACRPWLDAELARIRPEIVVCLGATAAHALLGRDFKVSLDRGRLVDSPVGPALATVHPSSILRAPDDKSGLEARAAFVADLRVLANHLARHRAAQQQSG
ncbi:MAG TPA: UdgX family uracil-DNA binding protein [Actinomycetota bacterium]|nr:UdgX family uracil-DNA binding protein [Actinomycetota bacterium]